MMNVLKSILIVTLVLITLSCEKGSLSTNYFYDGTSKALAGNASGAIKSFIRSIKSGNNANKSLIAVSVLNKLKNQEIDGHSSYFFFSALEQLTSGDIKSATANINKAVSSEVNFSEALILRAIIKQGQEDYNAALNDYTEATLIDPDKFNFVYNEKGVTHAYLGNFSSALKNFERAVTNNAKYAFAHYNKANTQSILNKYDEAIESYTQALSVEPNFFEVLFFRANAYLDLKDYENAIKDYNAVITVKPKFAMAYINRGVAYLGRDSSYEQARRDFSKATEIYPWYGLAYYNRAVTQSYLGNFESAIADYTKAIDQDPWYTKTEIIWDKNENKNIVFSKFEYERDKTSEANQDMQWLKVTGELFIYTKAYQNTVISDYDKASRLYPWYAMAYFNRAVVYAKSKQFDKAISDYNKALEINPGMQK